MRETVALLARSGIYDKVEHAMLQDWIRGNPQPCDLGIFSDVLQHLKRPEAFQVVRRTLEFAPHVIVNVPLRNLRLGQQTRADRVQVPLV